MPEFTPCSEGLITPRDKATPPRYALYEFSVFSNDGDFSLNLAKGKPISTKLYGSGGYAPDPAVSLMPYCATGTAENPSAGLSVQSGSSCFLYHIPVSSHSAISFIINTVNT